MWYPQGLQNCFIFEFRTINIIWMKDAKVKVYILGEKVETDSI